MGMFKCKDCDNYMLCEYYHNRKGTSKICSEFVKDAIPKADYEARLKADMVAMLTEISLEADELSTDYDNDTYAAGIYDYDNLVQDKIKKLRGEQE